MCICAYIYMPPPVPWLGGLAEEASVPAPPPPLPEALGVFALQP